MIRRLSRFLAIAGITAAAVALAKALTRRQDPLPVVGAPADEPWPRLRPEPTDPDTASTSTSTAPPTADAADVAPEPAADVVSPEPDGVPVASASWVDPTADGECPDGYPIKANLRSKIFHSPGQLAYDRTSPDRCYADASAAETDGLRAAKR